MELISISLENIVFAGKNISAVVYDISDAYVLGSRETVFFNNEELTNLRLGELTFEFLKNKVYGGGVRVNLSGQRDLFPTQTITDGDQKLYITNHNSNTVVANIISGRVNINSVEHFVMATRDVRGLGSFVYAPMIFWRQNHDNNKFLATAGTSESLFSSTFRFFCDSPGFGLSTDFEFPVIYQNDDASAGYNSASPTTKAARKFDAYTYIETEYHPFSTDPYESGGVSEQQGGEGDFDGTSDDIDFPAVPTLSASSTGFIKLFNPSIAQLNSLAAYMWSNPLFDLDAWKKIFADPMDAILGLSIVPVTVPNGGSETVTVGNISTGITMTVAGSQYVEIDCGTLNVNEYWGAYLDYDPYTRAELYLPYIGIKPISVDDIMGKAVAIKYHVDILSGACVAYIKCGDSVLYSYIGQCASSIPITGNDWTNVINGVMSIAGAIGTTVATGGATAPMALGTTASTMVNQMKPNIQKSGGMSGTGGILAIQKPYMILTRPRQALPENQNTFMGYPSFITLSLADVSGYTEIESIHLENMTGTGAEIAEIESILKTGVIL